MGYKVISRYDSVAVVQRTKTNFRVRWSEAGRRSERSFTTKEAAKKFALELAQALETGGGRTPPPEGLFSELVVDALRIELHPSWSQRHLQTYEALARNWLINEPVGQMKAKNVTTEALNEALSNIVTKKGYSLSTARHVKNIQRMACERGIDLGIYTEATNPMRRVQLPGPQKLVAEKTQLTRITHVPTDEQVKALADHLEAKAPKRPGFSGGGMLIRFAAETGLRQGEQLALMVRHINFTTGYVSVEASMGRDNSGRPVLQGTKTNSSKREVPLSATMLEELRELCKDKGPDDFVFSASRGGVWNRSYLTKLVRSCPEYAGFRYHDLRHYRASALVAGNGDPASIARFLGHANPFVSMTMYSHSTPQGVEALRALIK